MPDVGIRIIVEILDHHQDFDLTVGELRDLLVLAENANDDTRQTYGRYGVHTGWIRRRAGGKTPESWRKAIGKLIARKVLETVDRGHPGQVAVYRIRVLCPDPPHDGREGRCSAPECVPQQGTQPGGMGSPAGNPNDRMGSLTGTNGFPDRGGMGSPAGNPYSSHPSSPLSLADAAAERALRAAGLDDAREIKDCIDWITEDCRPRTPGWWRTVAENGDLPAHVARWRQQRTPAAPSFAPWCGQCGEENPAARTNVRFRVVDGEPCPTCHPNAVGRSA